MGLVAVADVGSEAEAAMVLARLRDAGVVAISRNTGPRNLPQFGSSATQTVYVEEAQEAAAREALDGPPISDEELAALAEEAGRDQGGPPAP